MAVKMYSKEMKTTRKRVEDARKENREECMLMGGDINGKRREKGARNWKEERGDGKKIQRQSGECSEEGTDGMD
jgi:hypothetical protein